MRPDVATRRSPSTPTHARTLTHQASWATLWPTRAPRGRLGCEEGHRTARTTRRAIAPACSAHAATTHGHACKRSSLARPPQLGDEGDELEHPLADLRLHAVGGLQQPKICRDSASHVLGRMRRARERARARRLADVWQAGRAGTGRWRRPRSGGLDLLRSFDRHEILKHQPSGGGQRGG
uniref:Uncharacterized protein n=1 Tax=Haptolina ericina TaxID=156174 RepID=A0A6T9KRV8_9EUKA|mmetsp:Transcript_58422/g.130213  ORF Transcript_58422/g.130213 Transcript_58422/m.130213 type:complete len:180 (+) Transcript_58422:121-660(+)